jgi:hypothetical protein
MLRATTALIAASAVGIDRAASADTAFPDSDVRAFVNLSAALTGLPTALLMPNVDPVDLKRHYLEVIKAQPGIQQSYENLLKLVPANVTDPGTIRDAITKAGKSDDGVKYLARSIVLLWYLGAWYEPSKLKDYEASQELKDQPTPAIPSSKAYTHGLVWRVAQAHPMGYSDMQFGYWKDDPTLVERFVGGVFQ